MCSPCICYLVFVLIVAFPLPRGKIMLEKGENIYCKLIHGVDRYLIIKKANTLSQEACREISRSTGSSGRPVWSSGEMFFGDADQILSLIFKVEDVKWG